MTIIYYSRLIAYRSLTFVVTEPGGHKIDMAAEAWQLPVRAHPLLLEHPSLRTCLLVLLAVSVVSKALAAYLCSQREFHVKTPEES